MTGEIARRFGIHDRGVLEEGKRADITVFSPSELSEGEDGRNRGFRLVMVNGKIALKDDRVTEISEGRILRV